MYSAYQCPTAPKQPCTVPQISAAQNLDRGCAALWTQLWTLLKSIVHSTVDFIVDSAVDSIVHSTVDSTVDLSGYCSLRYLSDIGL